MSYEKDHPIRESGVAWCKRYGGLIPPGEVCQFCVKPLDENEIVDRAKVKFLRRAAFEDVAIAVLMSAVLISSSSGGPYSVELSFLCGCCVGFLVRRWLRIR